MSETIQQITQTVHPIMSRYGVRRARAFGSAARGDMKSESDVDILVSFERPIDGWTFAGMADELEQALGRPVDLVTEKGLSENLRSYVERDLVSIYGA